jgi:transposase
MQAQDRTQPGLPMKRGRCGTMTHDYKRNGTTTLFAALNTLNGSVIQTCMPKHRHQEWIRFLSVIKRQAPTDQAIHIICDNYATHKHPKVIAWLNRHPRFHADQRILAEHGRAFLPRPLPAPAPTRRIPIGGGAHLIERRHIDRFGVEDEDVGSFPGGPVSCRLAGLIGHHRRAIVHDPRLPGRVGSQIGGT